MGVLSKLQSFIQPKNEDNCISELGRNELCWCGSGIKYKKCHLREDEKKLSKQYSTKCRTT